MRWPTLVLALTLAACGGEEDDGAGGGDGSGGAGGDAGDAGAGGDDFCAQGWPDESWVTFGEGFTRTYCRSCHGADSVERNGAPPDVNFDTRDESLALAPRILARVVGPQGGMPPAGGPPPETIVRVRIWLECSAEATAVE